MSLAYCILFLIGSLMPGFFLFNFFRDAYEEYKHTGVFSFETLFGNPVLFAVSLLAFLALVAGAVLFALSGL